MSSHRRPLSMTDVLALDRLAERINHRYSGRHAAGRHAFDYNREAERHPFSSCTCTGEHASRFGCCPQHAPDAYTDCMASHATDCI